MDYEELESCYLMALAEIEDLKRYKGLVIEICDCDMKPTAREYANQAIGWHRKACILTGEIVKDARGESETEQFTDGRNQEGKE